MSLDSLQRPEIRASHIHVIFLLQCDKLTNTMERAGTLCSSLYAAWVVSIVIATRLHVITYTLSL